MMYKVLHWIFNWDYIAWRSIAGNGIARVHINPQGIPYFWKYKNTKVVEIIADADHFLWLTCKPEKYISATVPRAESSTD